VRDIPTYGYDKNPARHRITDTVPVRYGMAAGYRARQVTALLYHQAGGEANIPTIILYSNIPPPLASHRCSPEAAAINELFFFYLFFLRLILN
jgi:hypothetical protein